jgi:hypothetical protein
MIYLVIQQKLNQTIVKYQLKYLDDESPIDKSVELSPTDGSDKSSNKSKKLKNRFKSKVNNGYKFDEYDNDYDDTYDKYYENI